MGGERHSTLGGNATDLFTLTSEPRSLNFWARAAALHRDNTILYVKQQMSNRKKETGLGFSFPVALVPPHSAKAAIFSVAMTVA